MASLTQIKQRFWNNDGTVAAGGFVYVYLAGTTTPTNSYTDATGSTPNANPVVLDSKGEASIFTDRQVKINVLQSDLTQITGYPVDYTGQVYASISQIQSQSITTATTAGTSTAYTLAPSPAITAYAIGQEFDVIFNAACGATPTINVNGLGAVNLVDRLVDGTYYNIPSGRIPINWRSKCVMVSLTQMLVRDTPCETVTSTVLIASAVALVTTVAKNVTSISVPPGNWKISGNIGFIPVAATVTVFENASISATSNTLGAENALSQIGFGASKTGQVVADFLTPPDIFVSLSVTTTYYLIADASFTVSTMSAAGTIIAMRYK
jgi:hypothetical protein